MITVPATMRAVIAPRAGGLEALTVVERPLANPAADEILIAVRAAGLCFARRNLRKRSTRWCSRVFKAAHLCT